jgi:hypothetical protein
VSSLASSFPTYLWHYLVARLLYDHLYVVLIAVAAVLLLSARRRR